MAEVVAVQLLCKEPGQSACKQVFRHEQPLLPLKVQPLLIQQQQRHRCCQPSFHTHSLHPLSASAVQKIVSLAREADPDGLRTVGVLTKADRIELHTHHLWLPVLNNTKYKLNLGYFCVVNPSPKDIVNNMTEEQATEKEAKFFRWICSAQSLLGFGLGLSYSTSAATSCLWCAPWWLGSCCHRPDVHQAIDKSSALFLQTVPSTALVMPCRCQWGVCMSSL